MRRSAVYARRHPMILRREYDNFPWRLTRHEELFAFPAEGTAHAGGKLA